VRADAAADRNVRAPVCFAALPTVAHDAHLTISPVFRKLLNLAFQAAFSLPYCRQVYFYENRRCVLWFAPLAAVLVSNTPLLADQPAPVAVSAAPGRQCRRTLESNSTATYSMPAKCRQVRPSRHTFNL